MEKATTAIKKTKSGLKKGKGGDSPSRLIDARIRAEMATDDLRSLLTRDPFVPFRVCLTSGGQYDIRDPLAAALMKSRLFIALPRSDRSVYVP